MSELLRLLVSLSLSGGVLTLLTAALNRLLRRRMPHGFLYALWLLALLRFLCPLGSDGSLAHRAVSQPQAAVVLVVPSQAERPAEPAAPASGLSEKNSSPDLSVLLTGVWAAVALSAAGRRWGGYALLKRRLYRDSMPVAEWELALLQTLTCENRRAPRLLRSAAADTPMLTGLFRPVIWLPAGAWSEKELGYALRHELLHWRRHDLLFKWIAVGTACLYWFNPAAWYLVRAVERDGELSCDEAVARTLSPTERTGYGELLLRCAMGQASRAGRLTASLKTQKQDLKVRLTMIMRTQPDPKQARRLLAAVVVLLVTVSACVGAYAIDATPDPVKDDVQTDIQTLGIVPEEMFASGEWTVAFSSEQTHLAEEPQADGTDDAELPDLPEKDAPLAWPFEVPSDITLSTLFGRRVHPVTGAVITHDGIDIILDQDTPVLAAAGGVVTTSAFTSDYGNYVVLSHPGGLSTLYAHLTGDAMPEEGSTVEAGQQIGAVGMSGMATGYHLHFQVWINGSLADPLEYLPWKAVVASSNP